MKNASGFTLIELLVFIAIVVIIMAIGTPSYQYVTNNNRMAGEINALLGDMQYARAEAIKQGLPVTVCPSTDGSSCTGAKAWQTGWIIFVDVNGNGTVDTGDTLLRKQRAFSGNDTFVADNVTAVTFNREGFAPLGSIATMTLKDSTNSSKWRRCLAVNMVGRVAVQTPGTGNCA